MRLIDADALKVELGIADECDDCERHGNLGCINCTLATVCDRIDNAPTIDDMPVDMSISSYTIDYLEKISKQLGRIIELQKYQLKEWVDRKYE